MNTPFAYSIVPIAPSKTTTRSGSSRRLSRAGREVTRSTVPPFYREDETRIDDARPEPKISRYVAAAPLGRMLGGPGGPSPPPVPLGGAATAAPPLARRNALTTAMTRGRNTPPRHAAYAAAPSSTLAASRGP